MKRLIFAIFMALSVQFAVAQEKEEAPKPQNDNVMNIKLAAELAQYGYDYDSPTALIQAATILNEVQLREFEVESIILGEGEDGNKKDSRPAFTVEQLIKDALELAGNDDVVSAMASRIKVSEGVTRGRVGGAISQEEIVKANTTDIYNIKFYASETAEVLVIGDGDTDLDLYVYDSNGNLICKDDDYTDDCYCRWTPKWTGTFRIEIKNRGSVYNKYVIATN